MGEGRSHSLNDPLQQEEVSMMRHSLLLVFCALIFMQVGNAQIPNQGFENWTGTEPDGWVTSNVSLVSVFPVTRTADAYSGSYALRGDVIPFPFTATPYSPIIQTGPGARGFAVSVRHAMVTGYYKFFPTGGDRLGLNFGMKSGGNFIAIGAQAITAVTSSWTQFAVTFNYSSPAIPDTCILQISIVGPITGNDYHIGSYFQVDDLAFVGTDGVAAAGSQPVAYALEQNYPNPFNPVTNIQFTIVHRQLTIVNVYDMLGRDVATLVNEVKEPGTYTVQFDGSNLASGLYFYRLTAGSYLATHKMILMR
jgi:hypothetical protein